MNLQFSNSVLVKSNSVNHTLRKVLFVIDTLELGGAEQSLLANVLRFKITQAVVCHIYKGETLKPKFIENGITVYSLNITEQYGFIKAYKQLKTIVNKERPNVMVAYLTRSEIVARLVGKFNNVPVIGTFVTDLYATNYNSHLSWMAKQKVWFFKQINKLTSSYCKGFLANSQFIKEANAKQLSIPLQKIQVLNRGRDSYHFICKNFDKKKEDIIIRFLNVSRLYHAKGQIDLILAFKRFVDVYPFAELHIIGEGPMRPKLEQLIISNQLEEKVFLLGARNDVPSIISLYDCFVFPSHVEGFSGSLVEAMFAGLPILATSIPQNKEIITHMETGYMFERENVDELEKAMFWFKDNIPNATLMAKKAYSIAKHNYELDKIVAQFENYLHNPTIYKN